MKWTKHPTNASTSDPIVNRLQEKFGIAGYAMCFKLIEVIGGSLEHKDQPPSTKLSKRTWAKLLMCRPQKLMEFLEVLQEENHISIELDHEFIEINMPSIRESLDNRAVSSALRAPSGYSEEKITELESTKINKEESAESVCLLSEEQLDRIKGAMTKGGADSIEATANAVYDAFRIVGESHGDIVEIERLIGLQFQRNEKSRGLGQSVLAAVKASYKKATQLKKQEDTAKQKEERQREIAKREKISPNKTDSRCAKVLRQLEAESHYEIEEMCIDRKELEYFIEKNIAFYGEVYVQKAYEDIIRFLRMPPPQESAAHRRLDSTGPQPVTDDYLFEDEKVARCFLDDPDDPDDDDDFSAPTFDRKH